MDEFDMEVFDLLGEPSTERWAWWVRRNITDGGIRFNVGGKARTKRDAIAAARAAKPRVEAAWRVLTRDGFPQVDAEGQVAS